MADEHTDVEISDGGEASLALATNALVGCLIVQLENQGVLTRAGTEQIYHMAAQQVFSLMTTPGLTKRDLKVLTQAHSHLQQSLRRIIGRSP